MPCIGQYRSPINYGPQIGFDNWELIAGHLNLLGLISLAEVCVDAQKAARLIFKRRYSSHIFRLILSKESFGRKRGNMVYLSDGRKRAWIESYTVCLKLLRNFGFFISQLEIDPHKHIQPVKLQKIIKYTNKYCPNSKNELVLCEYLPILFKEPLRNVNEVTVSNADFSVADFISLFPNIQNLNIHSDEGRIFLQHHFPRLEHLAMEIHKYDECDGINIVDIWRAIKLNPQIKSIYIEQIDRHIVGNMFKMVKNDSDIDLYLGWNLHWNKFKRFLLDIIRPVDFKKMHLVYDYEIKDIKAFVNKFKSLKCFVVESFEIHLLELIESLPMLQDFQICFREEFVDIDEHIDEMQLALSSSTIQQKLSVLSFHFEERVDFGVFQAGINRFIDRKIWRININEDGPKTYKQSMVLNRINLP